MSTNHIQSPFPLIHVDLNCDPNPSHDFYFPNRHDYLSSPSARILFPQQPHPHHQEHHPHRTNFVDELIIAQGRPHDHPPSDVIEGDHDLYHKHSHDHHHHLHHHEYCSVNWMSSKMRIEKKMTDGGGKPLAAQKFEQDAKHEAVPQIILENDSNRSSSSGIESNNNPIIIRVCSDCNTTKTPLWRSGPRGPKSLCNACGIRQRKARRAMALAAAAANGESPPYLIPDPTQKTAKLQQHKKKKKKKKKKKRSSSGENKDDDERDQNPKKKHKHKGMIVVHPPTDPRKLCFEEFMLRLSERISCFQGVFPQDEKEAALLLMALSYGFVQS